MKLVRRIDRTMRASMRAIEVTIAVVKFVVALFAALAGLSVVAAIAAYLKREQWTKPAYRWVRDASGRWSFTPWAPGDADGAGEESVAEASSSEDGAS
jgi:hypothetical protein